MEKMVSVFQKTPQEERKTEDKRERERDESHLSGSIIKM